ncbi:HEAT repeat domain-containing protein [Synechococcus sp. J7-Johnson]|uniref:HEAT repeat domain-containing protein n=1 Tax=Synechococcus sp. J7-Johnson TaxID=2823737 RepID=UPI0020CC10A9|nr:HEAT repeat domain-containing protein [Synechococcus sp. J7-Johnson]MCP9839094.1 HEAT repeat domain-containing protein [Synechococcus sp. J7-Johnson]
MQQALPAAAALLLMVWLVRSRRLPLLWGDDGSAVAALNRAQLERVVTPATSSAASSGSTALAITAPSALEPREPLPEALASVAPGTRLDPRWRRQVLAELRAAATGSEGERLAAVAACLVWGDRASLALLKRARFDPDPCVAALAAEGIAAFRGRTAVQDCRTQPARLPRNVARTR